jgi:hypothetical protein
MQHPSKLHPLILSSSQPMTQRAPASPCLFQLRLSRFSSRNPGICTWPLLIASSSSTQRDNLPRKCNSLSTSFLFGHGRVPVTIITISKTCTLHSRDPQPCISAEPTPSRFLQILSSCICKPRKHQSSCVTMGTTVELYSLESENNTFVAGCGRRPAE